MEPEGTQGLGWGPRETGPGCWCSSREVSPGGLEWGGAGEAPDPAWQDGGGWAWGERWRTWTQWTWRLRLAGEGVSPQDCLSLCPGCQWPPAPQSFSSPLCLLRALVLPPASSWVLSASSPRSGSVQPAASGRLVPLLSLSPGLSGPDPGVGCGDPTMPRSFSLEGPASSWGARNPFLRLRSPAWTAAPQGCTPSVPAGRPISPGVDSEPGHQPAGQLCSALGSQWVGTLTRILLAPSVLLTHAGKHPALQLCRSLRRVPGGRP